MSITSPSTLVLAGLLAGPTVWRALNDDGVTPGDAATRYLICVPVAALMLALLRAVTRDYGRATDGATITSATLNRRRDDGLPPGDE